MTRPEYFSDALHGPRSREVEAINPTVWGGFVALINAAVQRGEFGVSFPAQCPDGKGVYGVDESSFGQALVAEVPGLNWPLETARPPEQGWGRHQPWAPDTLLALDALQFCHHHIAEPIPFDRHDHYGHDHLRFDVEAGRYAFCNKVNTIFARNGLCYELKQSGVMQRTLEPFQLAALEQTDADPTEQTLDHVLAIAKEKIRSPDPEVRRLALEKLWDAFERMKTLARDRKPRDSIKHILETVAPERTFREVLDNDCLALTKAGNALQIRHFKLETPNLQHSADIDYLFFRLLNLMQRILKVWSNAPERGDTA